jgi:hypothetical protein
VVDLPDTIAGSVITAADRAGRHRVAHGAGGDQRTRTWRTGPSPDTQSRWVYLAEYDPGAPTWTASAEMRAVALDAGSIPAVESYWSGEALPPYPRSALEQAVVLWQRPPDRRGGPEAYRRATFG